MRVAVFSAENYERKLLDELNADHRHELVYFDTLLGPGTTDAADPSHRQCPHAGPWQARRTLDQTPAAAAWSTPRRQSKRSNAANSAAWRSTFTKQEAGLFFKDLSNTVITDDVIQRLVSFPNVIVTGHQAFFTREALGTILATTLASISDFAAGRPLANEIRM